MSGTLLDRLRETRCDREPFTPGHAQCICRLANEAAGEIDRLRECLARFSGLASSALAPLQIMKQEAEPRRS